MASNNGLYASNTIAAPDPIYRERVSAFAIPDTVASDRIFANGIK